MLGKDNARKRRVSLDDQTIHLKKQGNAYFADVGGAPWLAVFAVVAICLVGCSRVPEVEVVGHPAAETEPEEEQQPSLANQVCVAALPEHQVWAERFYLMTRGFPPEAARVLRPRADGRCAEDPPAITSNQLSDTEFDLFARSLDQAKDRDDVLHSLIVSLAYRNLEQNVVTTAVIRYLRGLPAPDRAGLIRRSILSQEPPTRRGGAVALAWFGPTDDQGLARLAVEALASSSLSSNRQTALAILGKLSQSATDWELNAIRSLLRDTDARVRIRATAAAARRCLLDQIGPQLSEMALGRLAFSPVPAPTEDERPFVRPLEDEAYRFVTVLEAANAYGQLCGDEYLASGRVWKVGLEIDTEEEIAEFIQSFVSESDGSLTCQTVDKLSRRLQELGVE